MATMVLAVGLCCGGIAAYIAAMAAVINRRKVCPMCRERRATATQHFRKTVTIDGEGVPETETRYRCEACSQEACQQNDGPLIPRARWDEGMRDVPPVARVVKE